MLTGQGKSVVNQIIHSLYEYVIVHFSTEEVYMIDHHYPHYLEHYKKHNDLKRRLVELDEDNVVTLSRFLTDWLINHIQEDDFKMVQFCNRP
jgi:hemerythrin-like metal-binding protein